MQSSFLICLWFMGLSGLCGEHTNQRTLDLAIFLFIFYILFYFSKQVLRKGFFLHQWLLRRTSSTSFTKKKVFRRICLGSHTWSRRKVFWRMKRISRTTYLKLARQSMIKAKSFCCQKMEKISAASEIGTISYDGACIKTDLLYAALVLQPSGYQASPPTCL